MRNTFRIHPKVRVNKIIHRGKFSILTDDDNTPRYEMPNNVIYLSGSSKKTVVKDLIHEINHWSMWGFLTIDEVWDHTLAILIPSRRK